MPKPLPPPPSGYYDDEYYYANSPDYMPESSKAKSLYNAMKANRDTYDTLGSRKGFFYNKPLPEDFDYNNFRDIKDARQQRFVKIPHFVYMDSSGNPKIATPYAMDDERNYAVGPMRLWPNRVPEYIRMKGDKGNVSYGKTSKRLYKQESSDNNDKNDKKKKETPRERGRSFIENIKGSINNTIRNVSDSYTRAGKNVNTAVNSFRNQVKDVASQPGKMYNEGKKQLRENFESGRTGSSRTNAQPHYLGEKMVRGIGNVYGILQGVNEAIGNPAAAIVRGAKQTGTRQAQLRGGKTNKRATPMRAKSVSNSRQGGFVNGKPVSIKKMASKNKYF